MKKLFTKLTSIMLVLVMLFGLTACFGGDGTGDGGITDDGGEEHRKEGDGGIVYQCQDKNHQKQILEKLENE